MNYPCQSGPPPSASASPPPTATTLVPKPPTIDPISLFGLEIDRDGSLRPTSEPKSTGISDVAFRKSVICSQVSDLPSADVIKGAGAAMPRDESDFPPLMGMGEGDAPPFLTEEQQKELFPDFAEGLDLSDFRLPYGAGQRDGRHSRST